MGRLEDLLGGNVFMEASGGEAPTLDAVIDLLDKAGLEPSKKLPIHSAAGGGMFVQFTLPKHLRRRIAKGLSSTSGVVSIDKDRIVASVESGRGLEKVPFPGLDAFARWLKVSSVSEAVELSDVSSVLASLRLDPKPIGEGGNLISFDLPKGGAFAAGRVIARISSAGKIRILAKRGGTLVAIQEFSSVEELQQWLESVSAKGGGSSSGTKMRCNECEKTFTKKIGRNTTEVKCPKCGGYDTEPA